MAIGDDAKAGGYPLVPDTGEEGKVRWGAREINRCRDYIAILKKLIPTGKGGYRSAAGISSSSTMISNSSGADGDIFFKIV